MKSEPKFKIGDKVEILSGEYRGMFGEIEGFDPEIGEPRVYIVRLNCIAWGYEPSIEWGNKYLKKIGHVIYY